MKLDSTSVFVIAILVVSLFVMIFYYFVNWYIDFSRELRAINNEINRCVGEEKQHYIRQRRRLFLSILPFVKY